MDTLIIRTAKIYVLFYVFIAIGIVYLVVLYTHRLAGPLQRIKSEAKSIGEGNLDTVIRLRRNDAISAFADTINAMTESLHEKVDYLSSESKDLKNAVQEVRSLAEENKDIESAFKKVKDHNSNIRKLLDSLKL
jgi:methyl-accepting chemotaxis protein